MVCFEIQALILSTTQFVYIFDIYEDESKILKVMLTAWLGQKTSYTYISDTLQCFNVILFLFFLSAVQSCKGLSENTA